MSAAVKPGYKQTEVGVIPEDWNIEPLGNLLNAQPTYGINAPAIAYNSRFPTYLRITDISEQGRFLDESKTSVSHPAAENYMLNKDDLVFARTGASVGKSYHYRPEDGKLVFAGFLIRFSLDNRKLVSKYLKFYVQGKTYWKLGKGQFYEERAARYQQPGVRFTAYSSTAYQARATTHCRSPERCGRAD